jgi:hypothetical protein
MPPVAIRTVDNTVVQGKHAAGDGLITNNSAGLKGLTTIEEEARRIKALGQRCGIGHEIAITYVEPWSLKPKPVPKPKLRPATPPTDISAQLTAEAKAREVATLRAVLAVHRRHSTPCPRAWRAATRGVRFNFAADEIEWRTAYLNGGHWPED